MSQQDNNLAYGHHYSQDTDTARSGEGAGTRGLGDTFKKLRDTYKGHHSPQPGQGQPQGYNPGGQNHLGNQSGYPQQYPHGPQNQGPPSTHHDLPYHGKPPKQDKVSGILGKLQGAVADIGSDVAQRLGTAIDPQAYAEYGQVKPDDLPFASFAPPRQGNDVKWYVDGCSYFYAVSKALEGATESVWILGSWLSPELYLRRPPAKNEQYRLDRMLQKAAQRGVRVNVIVHDEAGQSSSSFSSHTEQHLQNLHPNIAVFRYSDQSPSAVSWAHNEKLCLIDGRTAFIGGLDMCFGCWDTNQHALSDVHPANSETVFPGQDYKNARVLNSQDATRWEQNYLDRNFAPRIGWSDVAVGLQGQVVDDLRRHFVERWNFIYGVKYEARKDPKYSRLSLYGRPSSSISQFHQPQQVGGQQQQQQTQYQQPEYQQQQSSPQQQPQQQAQYQQPPYQQQQSSPQQQQQQTQYQQPEYQQGQPQQPQAPYQQPQYQPQQQHQQSPGSSYQPYRPGNTSEHAPSPPNASSPGAPSYQSPTPSYSPNPAQSSQGTTQGYTYTGQSFPPPPPGPPPNLSNKPNQPQTQQSQNQGPYFLPPPNHESQSRSIEDYEGTRGEGDMDRGIPLPRRFKKDDLTQYGNVLRGQLAGQIHQYQDRITSLGRPLARGNMSCQIVRSCGKWSHGSDQEHSIADAYAALIRSSEHFIYIENQTFITATGDSQKPVQNKIGAAIVERILRAARTGRKYKVIVVIPCSPGFAGDLSDLSTSSAREIMEFQYNSINRGGNSILELVAKEGYNPMDYIRFYNLRNYDRINISRPMVAAELESTTTAGPGGYGPGASRSAFDPTAPYQQPQAVANPAPGVKPSSSGRWDSVSECYMLNGEDIRKVPWDGPSEAEIDAFVTEQLYVNSKVMIADDRIVICGSANINDKSLLGDRDSEIAVIVEDYTPIPSVMDGKPFTASRFAASMRRELFRKHLGLLPPQDPQRPVANFDPVGVPNEFDPEAPESRIVADPLADTFNHLWNSRAKTNTEVFRKVFHAVPDDSIRDWATYKEFYGYLFHNADKQAYGQGGDSAPARYKYGHVVRDDFPPGPEGVKQVKELLGQVKGTLVEMPLMFLIQEDIARDMARLDLAESTNT